MHPPTNEQEPSTSFADTDYDVPDDFDPDDDVFDDIDDESFAEMIGDDDTFHDDTFSDDINSDDSDFTEQMNNDVDNLRKEAKEYVATGLNVNTQKKIKAAVTKFEKFVSQRGEQTNIIELDSEHLDAFLAVFLKGVKREDGNEYEPVSVQSFSSCIRKYLADKIPRINAEKSFPVAKSVLARKKKSLKASARAISPTELIA